MPENFSLVISPDKTEYKVGDVINVEFLVKNNFDEVLYFPRFGPVYTMRWLQNFNFVVK